MAVNLERVTSESTAAEWATVDAADNFTQTLQLASESSSVREHPVGPADGLGLLKVGIARHDVINFLLGTSNRDLDQITEEAVQTAQLVAQPQAHVGSDLLVARAAGVQFAADLLANDLAQTALVGGVDVLVVGLGLEGVGAPFLGDLLEAALDLGELLRRQDAGLGVGAGEGDRAGNVLLPHNAVIGKRGIVLLHDGVQALCDCM